MNEDGLEMKNLFGNVSLYSLDSILEHSHGIDQHGINHSTHVSSNFMNLTKVHHILHYYL